MPENHFPVQPTPILSSLSGRYHEDFAYAYGQPVGVGKIKSQAADFKVDEVLGYELSHEGEHLYLDVRKQNLNTDMVARILAKAAGIPPRAVSYSGLKDKQAVTRQWFSLHLPGQTDPDWSKLKVPADAEIEILNQVRHQKKLRRGAHQANRFVIRINALQATKGDLDARLQVIQENGIPNYFGQQRFGYDGRNLILGERLLKGEHQCGNRQQKGLYFSAVRSLLFNHVLSARVNEGSWNQYKAGDVVMLDTSHSIFTAGGKDELDEAVPQRVLEQQLHPTGPLWGEKGLRPASECAVFEQQCLHAFAGVCKALESNGLAYQRRALRLKVSDLSWQYINEQTLELCFSLLAGCFATSVLRELLIIN